MTVEEERTRLIGEIARVLRAGPVPDEARTAALTFIGWLARRMPGEPVSTCDLSRCRGYRADASAANGASGSNGSRRQSRPPRSAR
jgi:glucose-6-phosphate dehydrogenase assembly protein OpcA